MPLRTVNIAIIAYQKEGAKVQAEYGFRGQEVKVDDEDIERFDDLNGVTPMTEEELYNASDPSGPHPLDHGTPSVPPRSEQLRDTADALEGEDEDLADEPPAKRATLDEWQEYAKVQGVATEHDDGSAKTKKELISELTEED